MKPAIPQRPRRGPPGTLEPAGTSLEIRSDHLGSSSILEMPYFQQQQQQQHLRPGPSSAAFPGRGARSFAAQLPLRRRASQLFTFRAARLLILCALLVVLLVSWALWGQLPSTDKRRPTPQVPSKVRLPSSAFCSKSRPPLVCAHGGDSSHAPPNTHEAFSAALRGGSDCVEVDAAMTRDGHLVVLHVRELSQLLAAARGSEAERRMALSSAQRAAIAASRAQVGDFELSQLQELSWQPGGQRIMTVRDALTLTSPAVDSVTLDIKTYQDKGGAPVDEVQIAEQLVRIVHETGCTNCLIWAKSDHAVRLVKQLSPGQRVGYIVMNETEAAIREGMHEPLRMEEPEVVGMHHGMVDAFHLELLHGAGKQLHTWTINDEQLMRRVLDIGVDAVVTNMPKLAIEVGGLGSVGSATFHARETMRP